MNARKWNNNGRERLLQAQRVRMIMQEISGCISKTAADYYSDPSKVSALLDVLEPLCRCLGNVVLEAVSLADGKHVYLLRDPGSGRSIYELSSDNDPSRTGKTAMRALFVAEKNDAAKGIAAILSRGASTRRDGKSRFNKIYQFSTNVLQYRNCNISMTSVSGHLLQHDFPVSFKNWTETPIKVLFDAPVQKNVIPGMEDIKQTLIEEIRNSNLLVIWTDCDREGEAIGAEIVAICRQTKPTLDVYRARFSEITSTAVHRALNNLTRMDPKLVDAVECRNNFATIFRDKSIVSYGSCQFPTLGFIVERYQEIKGFIVEKFWKITLQHERNDIVVDFVWDRQQLFDRTVVQIFLDCCEEAGGNARVLSVTKKPKNRWRPVALDTVELEKLAVRKLKLSAKEAMAVAERLYNKGYISYPRTETNKFPNDIDLSTYVQQQLVSTEWGEFAQEVASRGPNPRNGTQTDEAHPPIHPLKYAGPNELVGLEWLLYEFVVRHFLACLSTDAKGQETKVHVSMGIEKFTASGLIIEDYGYLNVYKYEKWSDKVLPAYQENEVLTDCQVGMAEGQTRPPPLLNEADLIALMDKHGIGTDATHADHIETIKTRHYATLNGEGRFIPGYIGLALVDGYDQMGFAMSKPHMRANLESQLKKICRGESNKDDVLRDQIGKYRAIFEKAEVNVQLLSNALRRYLSQRENSAIPADTNRGNTDANAATTRRAPFVQRNAGGAAPAKRGRGNSRAASRGGSRGGSRPTTSRVTTDNEQVATANANDIELLSTLSILHTGQGTRSRSRASTSAGAGDRATARAQNPGADQGRLCRCGQAAKRLVVRKEGPNHGRIFWTCPKDRNDPQKCKYFEWEGPRNDAQQ